jgi:serine protease Do
MKMKLMRAAVLAAFLPVFAAGCTSSVAQPANTPNAGAKATVAQTTGRLAALPDFSQLVEQAGPAVVNISVTKKATPTAGRQQLPFDDDDPMSQYFRRFQMPKQAPMHGIGSGFIVSTDGYILTNAHVVDGANEVSVKLTDRREFTAKVVGADPRSDIAVLKIDAKNLPTVHIGDSKDVKVGQWVVAMGSPFGFENTVTAGIVSAKSRSLSGESYVPFIQTDVAVNPGNSGGPLFDMNGNVVGINSQIYSQTGGYMGLSFAIPIDVAMQVKDQLQANGKVTRGRIGVTVQSVNQNLAQSFGLPKPEGALVSSVDEKGPAGHAGIKSGDVILAFDGKTIDDSISLPMLVANAKPGKSVPVRVWRDGKETSLDVTVGTMPNDKVASADNPSGTDSGKLGLVVRPLTPEERQQSHVQGGLVVEEAGGAAAEAGVQAGDVILALNNEPVKSVQQLRGLVEKAGKHVALLVQRDEAKVYVPIDLG